MRSTLLACLLLLGACTIREETFQSRNDAGMDQGLNLTAPDASSLTQFDEDTTGCRGAFARGSQIQDLREGVRDPFCD